MELTLDNGKVLRFDKDAELAVIRGGELVTVYADELREDDDIQFDNRDLLFTLNKKFSNED